VVPVPGGPALGDEVPVPGGPALGDEVPVLAEEAG
jgi:hypothetical protein